MRWKRVWKSFQAVSDNGFIFSFTLLLALKLDHLLSHSWWFVFTPLWWLFHAVISCGRFSLPASSMPHNQDWTPYQYVMATPLLVAFEILLFLHLEDKYEADLKFVFLPLLAFEVAILVDNIRKCLTLIPRNEETMSEEPLLYTWVSIWMGSLIATITFTLVKSSGDVAAWEWWDLSIDFGISECFGFLVTKWWNQSIQGGSHIPTSSSMGVIYLDQDSDTASRLLDIGGYVMKIPFITFQVILFMSLEGTPASPKNIPIVVLFVPLFLLQGARVLSVTYISLAKSVLWIYSFVGPYGRYLARSSARVLLRFFQHCKRSVNKSLLFIYSVATSIARIFLGFFQHGARLLDCWSADEGSQEEQARLHTGEATGYNTFSPEVVKKMPKSDLVKEVRRLQAALSEQTDIRKQEYEKLQDEKILCKVCILEPIEVVLLPCKHRVLCSTCYKKCEICPICRALIAEGIHVYDA
ncbi:Transmembrane Fragile-X-F-associated protein [Raphanus sativus]|nr:Transmembrane Fragile-X-F-associated protein [Raphanus sativus]